MRAHGIDPETALYDAHFWAERLADYANTMREHNDLGAIVALIASALMAGSVWTVLANSPSIWAQIVVTLVAVVSAVAVGIPRIKNYAACAETSAALTGEYRAVAYALRAIRDGEEPGANTEELDAVLRRFNDAETKRAGMQAPPVHFARELRLMPDRPK